MFTVQFENEGKTEQRKFDDLASAEKFLKSLLFLGIEGEII